MFVEAFTGGVLECLRLGPTRERVLHGTAIHCYYGMLLYLNLSDVVTMGGDLRHDNPLRRIFHLERADDVSSANRKGPQVVECATPYYVPSGYTCGVGTPEQSGRPRRAIPKTIGG